MSFVGINWFRKDLRLMDNPSLNFLSDSNLPILNIFIYDEISCGPKNIGEASKVWLHHALKSLNEQLNGNLIFFNDSAIEVFKYLTENLNVKFVSWNRCYEPWRIERDKKIKIFLEKSDIKVKTFNGSLLWEPWNILKTDGSPYKVYSPYYKRGCLNSQKPRYPFERKKIKTFTEKINSMNLEALDLLPKKKWGNSLVKNWDISETGAHEKKSSFFRNGLKNYKVGRNFPAETNTSFLSPYIHWGIISTNTLWHECELVQNVDSENIDHFKSELGWREFSYYLLYHFPKLNIENFQPKFNFFPWEYNKSFLSRWQKGITGYPIVDAGMRELRQTGFMHNRLRMIVGSFLVKNLLIHWKEGENWFWNNLFDADLANNSAGWQWVAGSGADAAPYFRIFNPVSQGLKFDYDGSYTKKFVPELEKLPAKYLFSPWELSTQELDKYGVRLGYNYPNPMVDLKESRNKALSAFQTIRKQNV